MLIHVALGGSSKKVSHDQEIYTVYHELRKLVPGESIQSKDMAHSGVSKSFYSMGFNEYLPLKHKELVSRDV